MTTYSFYIVGSLDHTIVASVFQLASQLAVPQADPSKAITELIIPISSLGGDIGASIAIYNILRSIKIPVTTHNIGEVTSGANIIFLAGEKRRACKHSYFRHHGTFYPLQGTSHRVVYEDALETLKIGEKIMTDIIVERTNLSAKDVETYFRNPGTIDPDAALKAGIIHEIGEIG
jgi:ATP-dependent protease ClpP protease subunit